MTFITRAVSTVAFTAALFATTSPSSPTPFQATTLAYRDQVDDILGYPALQSGVHSAQVTDKNIFEAASIEANTADANFVKSVLQDLSDLN